MKNLFEYARNLSVYWASAGYYEKVQMQYWLFPEGISYSKKTDECRTKEIDSAMLYIALLTQDLGQKKTGIPELNISYSGLVPQSAPDLNQFYADLRDFYVLRDIVRIP